MSISGIGGTDNKIQDLLNTSKDLMSSNLISKDEENILQKIANLLADGIQLDELDALIALIGAIGGDLPSELVSELLMCMRELKKDLVKMKLESKGIDVDKISERVLQQIMEILMDKLNIPDLA